MHEVIPTAFSLVRVVVFRLPATFNSKGTDGECEQNTFSHQHVQMRTLCPHITLHSFLVPHLWLKVNLPKMVVSFHLSRDVSCRKNTQHFILYFFLCFRSPKVAHIQNLSQNKQEETAKVHIIDHRADTAENFVMRRRTAGSPRKINLRLALARAGLMTETKARTNDNQAQQY